MLLETSLYPRAPFDLRLSARTASDATRVWRDGVLTMVFEAGGSASVANVYQRPEGTLAVRLESDAPEAAVDLLRFILATDDDHAPFLARFAHDPLIGRATHRLQGLRPVRSATVAHALLKAVCGQLIQARAARALEARLLRLAAPDLAGLRLPPTRSTFARFSPAELGRHGLVSRKATALIRLSRTIELERLRAVPTDAAVARIVRERGLGPWSAGVICLQGLGRYEHGLVGDLGLLTLCGSLLGRRAEPEDTAALLDRYDEWAGLASVYLLASGAGGWTPLPDGRRSRQAGGRPSPTTGAGACSETASYT